MENFTEQFYQQIGQCREKNSKMGEKRQQKLFKLIHREKGGKKNEKSLTDL